MLYSQKNGNNNIGVRFQKNKNKTTGELTCNPR